MYVKRMVVRRRDDVARTVWPLGGPDGGVAEQYFTQSELDYCTGRVGSLGARLLIKDCVFSYLAAEFNHVERRYRELEIAHNERKGPVLRLFGGIEERVRRSEIEDICVSISHSRNWIAAMVLFCY